MKRQPEILVTQTLAKVRLFRIKQADLQFSKRDLPLLLAQQDLPETRTIAALYMARDHLGN